MLVGAARSAAREAAVTSEEARVRSAMTSSAVGLDGGTIDLSITRTIRGSPTTVSLVYRDPMHVPFIGWLFPSSVTLHASAAMRQEFG